MKILLKKMINTINEMRTATTYPIEVLAKAIPSANIKEISEISAKMKDEQEFYNNRQYHQMLILISERLIHLSRQRRSI